MLIQNYNPNWKTDFESIKELLLAKLDSIAVTIKHVGSTAVESMPAKPIIDIAIIYNGESDFEDIRAGLGKLGYYHNGDQGIEGREVFKRMKYSKHLILDSISHHLYVCYKENEELKRHLLFRDHLRENEDAREYYTRLKTDLAKKANQDKKIYAQLKENETINFINECIKKQETENEK